MFIQFRWIYAAARAGTAISALVFGYGILQTGISPLIGFIVDYHGYAPARWLVGITPMGAWWLLRTKAFRTATEYGGAAGDRI